MTQKAESVESSNGLSDDPRRAFERPTNGKPYDETDISLRAYVTRIPPAKLKEYDPTWSDDQVMEWDGNFREDGDLMLVCCERDVDVTEFRRVLEEYLSFLAQRTESGHREDLTR